VLIAAAWSAIAATFRLAAQLLFANHRQDAKTAPSRLLSAMAP
jgi:hypothetical protein